jgi:hypothetical protein
MKPVAYTKPTTPGVAQESTLQEILLVLGGATENATIYDTGSFKQQDAVASSASKEIVLIIVAVANGNGASSRWWQLFDSAAVPADSATPYILPVPLIINSTMTFNFTAAPLPITNGISWAVSATQATLTSAGVTDKAWVDIWFRAQGAAP